MANIKHSLLWSRLIMLGMLPLAMAVSLVGHELGASTLLVLLALVSLGAALAGGAYWVMAVGATMPQLMRGCVAMAVGSVFGMLLGAALDASGHGLHGLVSLHAISDYSFAGVLQKLQHMPWTYLGMLAGGNGAMLLLDTLSRGTRPSMDSAGCTRKGYAVDLKHQQPCSQKAARELCVRGPWPYLYLVCNAGMMFGMLIGDVVSVPVPINADLTLAASVLLLGMVLWMLLGMVLALQIWLAKSHFLPIYRYKPVR